MMPRTQKTKLDEPLGEPSLWGDSGALLRIHGGGLAGAAPYLGLASFDARFRTRRKGNISG